MPRPKPGGLNDLHVTAGAVPCVGLTDLFYSELEDDIARAKAVCATCRKQAACLEQAIRFRENWGIWGGCTPEERKAIRKRRRQVAA